MTDNKSKRGGMDRKRVASTEGYEVAYFARKYGLSGDEPRELIKQVGNDREKLNAAAEKLKKRCLPASIRLSDKRRNSRSPIRELRYESTSCVP